MDYKELHFDMLQKFWKINVNCQAIKKSSSVNKDPTFGKFLIHFIEIERLIYILP